MAKYYSVYCTSRNGWCGLSPCHILQVADRPFRSMMSTDMAGAVHRRNSLMWEFRNDTFEVREIEN